MYYVVHLQLIEPNRVEIQTLNRNIIRSWKSMSSSRVLRSTYVQRKMLIPGYIEG